MYQTMVLKLNFGLPFDTLSRVKEEACKGGPFGVFTLHLLPATLPTLPAACPRQKTVKSAARKLWHSIKVVHTCCNH